MRFLPSRFLFALTGLLLSAAICSTPARAQDKKADDKKPRTQPAAPTAKSPALKAPASKTATKAGNEDVLKKWEALCKRREEIGSQLSSLNQAYQIADAKGQKDLEPKFEKLRDEFLNDIQPSMMKVAPQVLKKDPKNLEAAETVCAVLFDQNKFDEIIATGGKFVEDPEQKSAILLNLVGASYYATHDFEKALEVLNRAEAVEQRLFQNLGARYLAASADYVDYWKQEQEIRAKEAEADDLPRVLFKTSQGDIVIELFENEAPNTVANFISLVEAKKYDGTVFHRVIPNFMAQGGDPNTLDDDPSNDGQGGPGYKIACECYRKDARKHFRASLSMAHAGKDSGGSQFFITHLPTMHLNPSVREQRGHTVFGRVIDGLDVAAGLKIGDKIESATVLRKRDHEYVPEKLGAKKPAAKAAPEKKSEE